MSFDFNVSHIPFRFFCDRLVSNNITNNLIIESSSNNIELNSNNQNFIFNNNAIFNYGINLQGLDVSNIQSITAKSLNINTLFLKNKGRSLTSIEDYGSIDDGYIRATTIANDISGRSNAYFTYIDVSGGDSSFNNSAYIKNLLTVNGSTTISNDLFVNGTSFVTLYNAINNYIINNRQQLVTAKVLTNDLSATNISISNELVVYKTSFLNDLSINGELLNNVLKVPGLFTIDPSGHGNASGTLIVNGDLMVYGNNTIIASSIFEISDVAISVASNLINKTDLSGNGAGLNISNVASLKYDGSTWNFVGGQLSVENKKVALDVSFIDFRSFSEASLNSLNNYFDLSYGQLKTNNDNSYNAIYSRSQIDNSFMLITQSSFDISYLRSYVDNSFVNKITFDGSFSALKTHLDASYITKGIYYSRLGQIIPGKVIANYEGRSTSVSINGEGNIVAIGTDYADINGLNTGANVRVYKYNSNSWTLIGDNIDSETTTVYNGNSVSLNYSGYTIAIGAIENNTVRAHVRVYRYVNDSSWIKISQTIDCMGYWEIYGFSVSLNSNGNIVAIGGPMDNGGIRVFQYIIDGSWTQLGIDFEDARHGRYVSLNAEGTILAVGTPGKNNRGEALVYRYNDISWIQISQTITGMINDRTGTSVSLNASGNILAVSSPNSSIYGYNSGIVRVYKYVNDSSWIQLGQDNDIVGDVRTNSLNNLVGDKLGYSISLNSSGNILAVSAFDNGINGGVIMVYKYNDIRWVRLDFYRNILDTYANTYFGTSIALNALGNRVIVSAPIAPYSIGYSIVYGTMFVPIIDSSLNFLNRKLDLSYVSNSVFEGSFNRLKEQIELSFASVSLTSLDSASISVETINTKHYSQKFNNILWNQVGLDISSGPPFTNNKKVAISNDGKVVAFASSAFGTVSVLREASGGTITISGGYAIHRFDASGTFTPYFSGNVEVLLVGGGGGGGPTYSGGGGGGGVVYITSSYITSGTSYSVAVGSGGASGTKGENTTVFGATAAGGGTNLVYDTNGTIGGCGGGAGASQWRINYGGESSGNIIGINNGIANVGFIYGCSGGNTTTIREGDPIRAAGGGGAGAQGAATDTKSIGDRGQFGHGSGGIGITNSILGTSYYWGGGGGGSAYIDQSGGYGGYGGGGGGSGNAGGGRGGVLAVTDGSNGGLTIGGPGGANTGGGGGGGRLGGGAGGSGIVVIRYLQMVSDISKGRIYVYELSYNQAPYRWNQLGLSSEIIVGLSNDDQFGWDLALSSNGRVVAGSSIANDVSGINSGQVRVYELSNNTNRWTQKGFAINGQRVGSESGYSISLAGNGNRIAIGAWKDFINGINAGAVRVYDFSATINDWRQQGQTIAGVSGSFEGYSTALSLDGQTLASASIFTTSLTRSGGTISFSGRYVIHSFTTVGSYTFIPDFSGNVEVLIVGGGGGGGSTGNNGSSGGGGAGGVVYIPSVSVSAGTNYPIVIGDGGASGTNGENSSAFTAIAAGGGRGGLPYPTNGDGSGNNGGSGGGAGGGNITNIGGSSSGNSPGTNSNAIIHGNNGGSMTSTLTDANRAAGGGGAGTKGFDTDTNSTADGGQFGFSSGGDGIMYNILGPSYYWGGGGGGAGRFSIGGWGGRGGGGGGGGSQGSNSGGPGGGSALTSGGAGNVVGSGAVPDRGGGNGGANTGGGGGGGSYNNVGGKGGSGIVVIRYLQTDISLVKTFTISGNIWTSKGIIRGPDINFGRSMKLSSNGNTIVIGASGYRYYTLSTVATNFNSHIAIAQQVNNRTLATITSETEYQAVRAVIGSMFAVWIGGRRKSTNPQGKSALDWEWINGDTWSIEKFGTGLPNDINSKGLRMFGSGQSGTWGDCGDVDSLFAVYMTSSSISNIGQAYVYGHQGGTTWTQLGQTIQGISGGDEFGSSVAISNDGSIISIGSDNNSSNRGHVRVFAYANNYWAQVSASISGKSSTSRAGIHALSGDGTTLIQSNNIYNSVYGINKTLAVNSPMTTISGNLIVMGNISVNSLDISTNHVYSSNGYSYKMFNSDISSAIMKEYYSDVTSTRHLKVQIRGDGNITNRNNSYRALSDSRLKENIVTSGPKLDDLLKVRVVDYTMKGSSNNKYIGVLAQELEGHFPNLVTELEPSPKDIQEGRTLKYKAVNYSSFDAILIKSLQEQNAMLKNITRRIETLEEALEEKL